MSLTDEILRAGARIPERQSSSGRSERKSSRQLVQDTITPYKICVLALVRLYLESKGDYQVNSITYTQEERRSLMLLFMKLIKVADMSYGQLLMKVNSVANPALVERFNSLILELANAGSCEYYAFFDRLNEPIKDNLGNEMVEFTALNKTSIIGIVVRSMLVAFKMMSLEDVISSVIAEFSKYCKEFTCKNGYSQPELGLSSPRSCVRPVPSRWQSIRRIAQLATTLEENARDAGSPAEVSEELNILMKTYPSLYRVHYVQYLNHMRVREYAGAKECLHRYFDKIAAEAGDRSTTKDSLDNFNKCYRYASLNLASLYARFGHKDLALHSVREAVKLAQETNDKGCLQHALIWLEHLSSSSGVHGVSLGLGLWEYSLTGSLIQTLKYTSLTEPPERVFDQLSKALSFQTRNVRVSSQSNLKTTSKLAQMTLCASLWNYYGQRSMANLISQNVLHTDSSDQSMIHCAENECLALCVLSNHHFSQGEYESAESILNIARDSFARPYPFSDIWSKAEQCQLSDRAFYHRDVAAMNLACDNLVALDPVEAALRRAKLYCLQTHYKRSLRTLEGILSSQDVKQQSFASSELRVRSLVDLIHVYCVMKDYPSATKYVTECLQLTSENHLIYHQALCQLYAAYIQLMSGTVEESFVIIAECLSRLLIYGSRYDKGRAQLLYAKCKIARAKTLPHDSFVKVVVEGLDVLDQAKENFQSCQAFVHLQDSLLYMSILCNMIGDITRRNSYSYQYRQIESQLALDKDNVTGDVIL